MLAKAHLDRAHRDKARPTTRPRRDRTPAGPVGSEPTTRVRDVVRRAYEEAVRSRYRSYARLPDRELSDADYVEIGPVSGGATRRYGSGHIYEGVERGPERDGGQLRGARVDAVRAGVGARRRHDPRRNVPWRLAQRPDSPAVPARTGERDETGAAPARTEPADGPAVPPASTRQVDKASATPASAPIAGADDVPCRRSCSLRYRACLARCRDQPITGGEYDACAYECSGGSLACRGACGASAAP